MSRFQGGALAAGVVAAIAAFSAGCGGKQTSAEPTAAAAADGAEAAPAPVTFVNVTETAGLRFRHENGAFGRKYLPETMGAGCAFLDYDNDGRQDIFLVNGKRFRGKEGSAKPLPALYRNMGNGAFEDVTRAAHLDVVSYGLGLALGDIDNDGDADLFVNALGPDHLFRNEGNGTFTDITAQAGVSDPSFGSSATFLDYDKDGLLDLFVCNYVTWSEADDLFCTIDPPAKSYCTPESYKGATNHLYRNLGQGRFEDVTGKAGVLNPTGKSLGVVVYDHDNDGWPDIVVGNDTQPNYLYRNRGDGTFQEIAREVGIAFSESGVARGSMGIDAADYDDSGWQSIVIGNFSNEMIALFHNEGGGLYVDDAPAAGVGPPSLLTLAFGSFFFDYDNDGRIDIFVGNGHVEPDINKVQKDVHWAEPPHLFQNVGKGRFAVASDKCGHDLQEPLVVRGAAWGDFDDDGDPDILVSNNGGSPRLLRNDGGNARAWLRVTLQGTKSARDAYGAELTLTSGGRTQRRTLRGSSSYCSQSEKAVLFGLGRATGVEKLEIVWPSGEKQTLSSLPVNTSIHVVEGQPLS